MGTAFLPAEPMARARLWKTWARIVREERRRHGPDRHRHVTSPFAAYQRDGVVLVRGAVPPDLLSLAEAGVEAVTADPSPRAIVASADDDPGFFIEDFRTSERQPELKQLVTSPRLGRLAAELTGSRTIRFYHDHVLVKRAGTRQPTPWHQDQPYYDIDGWQNVSFWIPVDPVPEEASLEVAVGSHLGPWYLPRTFLDEQARWFPEGTLAEPPDMEAEPAPFATVRWALEPGDLVAFHMAALHRAGAAPLDRDRRVVSVRYIGDDVVHAPRVWTTSPDFSDVTASLTPGDALDHPLFPLVWS